jgi:hypothetical protein
MPTTNSPKGSAIPVRPTPQMRQQLDELIAAGWGNQTDIIRTAIDRMHQQEIKMSDTTPKYFIPGNSTAALMLNRSGDIGVITGDYGDTYTVKFADNSEDEQWSYADGYTANTKKEAQKIADNYLHYQNEE